MATITLKKTISSVSTKSVLNINETSRTSTNTNFSLEFKTNLGSSNYYVGTGIYAYGKVEISGTGITTQSQTTTIKQSSEYWSGTAVHTKNNTFNVSIPSSATNVNIKYTFWYSDAVSDTMYGTTTLSLTKMNGIVGAVSSFNLEDGVVVNVPLSLYNNEYYYLLFMKDDVTSFIYYPTESGNFQITIDGEGDVISSHYPNSNEANITFELVTYLSVGGDLLGSSTSTTKGYIVNANPTFTDFDYEDSNETTLLLTGNNQKLINGKSNLKIKVPVSKKAEGNKGATISNYKAMETPFDYSSTVEVSTTLNNYSGLNVIVSAIDSRGNATNVSKELTVVTYNDLAITSKSIERTNNIGQETKISFAGTFSNVNFGAVSNSLLATYKYRIYGSTGAYTTGSTTITPTISSNNFSISDLAIIGDTEAGFNINNSYEIAVNVADKLSSYDIFYTLIAGVPAMKIKGNQVIEINGEFPSSTVVNTEQTTSDTETYSCNYINGIVESGSNTNGNWIKYENGIMICTNRYFIQTEGNTTTKSGALYVSNEIQGKNFPATFTSRPEIFFNFENATWGDKNIISIKTIGYPTTSVAPSIQLVSATSSTNTAINFEYLAIGKWK